ncbi:MAG: AhpC/TSA family protein [Ktedonobacterales bacterium]|nr:AhpC/TSA family protein [Ktedonobacterales bacterium]
MRLKVGQIPKPFAVDDIQGQRVSLDAFAGQWLLLSFLRFAACPRCGLRIYSLSLQYPTLAEQGLKIVAFVESSRENILGQPYAHTAPFPIVADPQQTLYKQYGVEVSSFGLWWGGLTRKKELARGYELGFGRGPMDGPDERMPADFLIAPDGRIRIAHYGRDSGDTLTFDALERALPPAAQHV